MCFKEDSNNRVSGKRVVSYYLYLDPLPLLSSLFYAVVSPPPLKMYVVPRGYNFLLNE